METPKRKEHICMNETPIALAAEASGRGPRAEHRGDGPPAGTTGGRWCGRPVATGGRGRGRGGGAAHRPLGADISHWLGVEVDEDTERAPENKQIRTTRGIEYRPILTIRRYRQQTRNEILMPLHCGNSDFVENPQFQKMGWKFLNSF